MSVAGPGEIFNPVQIQKILFLLDVTAGDRTESVLFNFTPYKYGPFDLNVYRELEELYTDGCVEILSGYAYKRFILKSKGFEIANKAISDLDDESKLGLEKLVTWILKQEFIELVKAIYKAYPNTQENSIIA